MIWTFNQNLNFCSTTERYDKNKVINNFKEITIYKLHFALQENDINQLNYKENIPKQE